MEVNWEGTIEVAAPVETAYRYLADLPRHREWAQSVERLELQRPGDVDGVGACYLTYERQGLQDDRRPHEEIGGRAGIVEKSLVEMRELVPNRRVALQAHSVPRKNIRVEIAFEFAPLTGGGTRVTQRIAMKMSPTAVLLARLLLRVGPAELRAKTEAQWRASLENVRVVLAGMAGSEGVGRGPAGHEACLRGLGTGWGIA
ncbi:MAG: SRPBCC family protein [Chloroflexia bacterium]